MILKSYIVENNINSLNQYKCSLIYGENLGLKDSLKEKILADAKNTEVINLYQEDFRINKDILIDEIKNVSLFAKEKTIIINYANDKIVDDLEFFLKEESKIKIFLISELLEKKSKIRSLFEKKKNLAIVPCYNDNEITLKKIIFDELREYKNLNQNVVNMILNFSNLNRSTLRSNLNKIKIFFEKKIISDQELEILLNSDKNEIFEKIRDATLDGNKKELNNLFNNFTFVQEDTFMYLNVINSRLLKLLEIHNNNTMKIDIGRLIETYKPPIFWKDKPKIKILLTKWDKRLLEQAIVYIGKVEKKIKTNSKINAMVLMKNSIINVCTKELNSF